MKFYKKLYMSEYYKDHLNKTGKVIKKIRRRDMVNNAYIITLREKGGLMDIIYAPRLYNKYYPADELYIIGIAEDYESAAYLAGKIALDAYEATGSYDVYHFIKEA